MQLDAKKFALAATGTMGIVYVVCAIFVVVFPDFSLKMLGWLMHLVDVAKFAGGVQVTFAGFAMGLLQTLFYSFASTYIFAALYNKLVKSEK